MKTKFRLLVFAWILMIMAGGITVQAAGFEWNNKFELNSKKVQINIGDSYDLDVTGTEKIPKWTTWGINKVKVDQDGVITGIRAGKTTVSARIGLNIKKCIVTVVDPSIKLNKKTATIYAGGTSTNTVQLKAVSKGTEKEIVWKTSDPGVAVVDENGKVTSVAAGTAVITATGNRETASCEVTVKESSIALDMESLTLSTKGNGSSIKLTPAVVGSSRSVKWTSNNKQIAVVSGGKVTGKKSGTAVITATANGISASCKVVVTEGSVSIDQEKLLLYTGETMLLKTNAEKGDSIIWKTSDETVARVDENGKVTAVGAGSAVLIVECNGSMDSCEIMVKDTAINIGENAVELKTGGTDRTYSLNYEVTGRKAAVKWTTSDKQIAVVKGGKITAKKAGIATITATANGVSDTVQVTVKEYEPSIKLNQSEYILYTKKGNTLTLKAAVTGKNKKVEWNSSDPSVAKVSKKGKVTALKEGQTMITATANGVTAECLVTVIESKVLLEAENIFMEKNDQKILPADIVGVSQTAKYRSSNSKVVTVKNGVLTAKKYGEADIKVTANGITSICHVSVDECLHEFDDGKIKQEATCTAEGINIRTCMICGDQCKEKIVKTDHIWEETQRTEATCTNSGTILFTCANCSETRQETLETVDHVYGVWTIITEATEFTEGVEKQYCIRCGAENERSIPTSDHVHSYTDVLSEPTCIEKGYTTHICSCGDFYIDSYVDTGDHIYGEYTTIQEPDCTTRGSKQRICTVCGDINTSSIDRLGHDFNDEYTMDVEPTCEKEGSESQHCSRCEKVRGITGIPALGHDFSDEYTVDKEATCMEEGIQSQHCSRCDAIQNKTAIPKTEHHSKDGYCTECGEKVAGLYNADGTLVVFWEESGMDIQTEYSSSSYKTDPSSPYYVLTNVYPETVKIIIPDGIRSIAGYAFYNCSSLMEIEMPDSLNSIGYHAFEKCTGITDITLPEAVTTIEGYAFAYCSGLGEITIPEGVTVIGQHIFEKCASLKNVTLPDSVDTIEEYAFYGCPLSSIVIPENIRIIAEYAFGNCSDLTSIYIPTGISIMRDFVFGLSSSDLQIYCGKARALVMREIDNGFFGAYWNYCDKSTELNVNYNVTKEEYQATIK